ncbi:MAG: hypothetical protein ACRD2Z_09595, partial [Thermoanaerobaculia bacterium]
QLKGNPMIDYTLKHGSHDSPQDGLCAMEWVAYLAGERHSDSPECVDPALRRFGIRLNDALPDGPRQKLRPYLARMIGTAGDGRTQERLYMMADWAVRVVAAEAQEVTGRRDLAERLRALPAIKDKRSAQDGERVAREVASANAAAFAATTTAASTAAAAYAATTAAHAATANTAGNAAYAATSATADAATWVRLLPSVLDLLDRMLPTEQVELGEAQRRTYEELCAA